MPQKTSSIGLSSHSKKYVRTMDGEDGKQGGVSSSGSSAAGSVGKVAVVCCVVLVVTIIALVGQSKAVTTPASLWQGSYHTAGCDVARCCCAKNLNVREVSPMKVMLSGRLDGQV